MSFYIRTNVNSRKKFNDYNTLYKTFVKNAGVKKANDLWGLDGEGLQKCGTILGLIAEKNKKGLAVISLIP